MPVPSVSVIVITKNAAAHVERALRSVAWADERIVVDAGSTDDTVVLARPLATRVETREWSGYGDQKNFAASLATHDWVLSLDADEALSPELAREIASLDFSKDGYELPRRSWYLGRWITHGTWGPDPVLRLFRRDKGRFSPDLVHETVVLEGSRSRLHGSLDHWPYRDLSHHHAKIDALSTLAAERMFAEGRRASWASLALKPGFEFLRSYVLRAGFLDGAPGLIAAGMHAHYNFLKQAKLWRRAWG